MRQAIRTLLRGSRELLEVNRATSTPLSASARMNRESTTSTWQQ